VRKVYTTSIRKKPRVLFLRLGVSPQNRVRDPSQGTARGKSKTPGKGIRGVKNKEDHGEAVTRKEQKMAKITLNDDNSGTIEWSAKSIGKFTSVDSETLAFLESLDLAHISTEIEGKLSIGRDGVLHYDE